MNSAFVGNYSGRITYHSLHFSCYSSISEWVQLVNSHFPFEIMDNNDSVGEVGRPDASTDQLAAAAGVDVVVVVPPHPGEGIDDSMVAAAAMRPLPEDADELLDDEDEHSGDESSEFTPSTASCVCD